jgi:hypothetical protein
LKRVSASVIAGRVQRADLTGEVSLETTDTDQETCQSDEKGDIEGYKKLASRHEQSADGDRACATEETIRQESAAYWCKVN